MSEGSAVRGQRKSIISIVSTLSTFPKRSGLSKPPALSRRRGFSLVEILVATTLLLIITVIISMVFQQAGGAWASGTGRANAESAIRGVLGSIERDLLNAVDARDYDWPNPSGTSKNITFIALQHNYNHKDPTTSGRTPCIIDYTFSGTTVKRIMSPLRYIHAGPWSDDSGSTYSTESIINGGTPLTDLSFVCIDYTADPGGLPLRVEITAAASHAASFFTIRGRSSGSNKRFEEWQAKKSDDIRVGSNL